MPNIELNNKPSSEEVRKEKAISIAIQSFFGTHIFGEMNDRDIPEMMEDCKIKSKWNIRRLATSSRNMKITANNGNIEFAKKLEQKFKNLVKEVNVKEILDSKLKRYSIQEILFNADYTMKELIVKPNEYFSKELDLNSSDYNYVWTSTISGYEQIPYWKFLISENEPNDKYIIGKTELNAIWKLWKASKDTLSAATSIMKKFGIPIFWFTYNAESTDEDIEIMASNAERLGQKSVIGIESTPGGTNGFNKDFGLMTMENLTTDIHINLLKYIDDEYSKYFLGTAGIQQAGTGSYAAKTVDDDIKDEIIESDCKYIEEKLQQLLQIDGYFFGYNSDDYKFELVERENPVSIELSRRAQAERLDILLKNYDIAEEYIAETQGIPVEYISKKQSGIFPAFQKKEFAKSKSKLAIEQEKIFNDSIESSKKKITAKMSDNIKEAVLKCNSISDLYKSLDVSWTQDLQNNMLIAYLVAYDDVYTATQTKEFEAKVESTVDIFNMPFEEAITYFQSKYPELWEELDTYDEAIRERFFWVKKTTDLEVTKKIQKSLIKALEEGQSFQAWINNLDDNLKMIQLGADGAYLETVYRTNLSSAYATGRYETQTKQKSNFPYWQYAAVMDARTTDICSELNNKVYRADDPIWNTIYPPNHYNERSTVIALADYDMQDEGLGVDNSNILKESQVYKDFKQTTFYGNPAKSYVKNMEKSAEEKQTQVNANAKELKTWQ